MRIIMDLETKKIIDSAPKALLKTDGIITNNPSYVIAEIEDALIGFDEDIEDANIKHPVFRDLTEFEIYPYIKQQWKNQRQDLVDNIEVTYNNIVYQGDEKSQDRMSRALNGMPDGTTIPWKAKDNSTQTLSKIDLKEILYLAGQEQTRIWFENEPIN